MITVDNLEMLLTDLKRCPVGHSTNNIKFIEELIAEINNSPMETVQITACKGFNIREATTPKTSKQ